MGQNPRELVRQGEDPRLGACGFVGPISYTSTGVRNNARVFYTSHLTSNSTRGIASMRWLAVSSGCLDVVPLPRLSLL